MNRADTARCYALVCGAYGMEANESGILAWHALLGELDAAVAEQATRRLCARDSSFAPRPGEILAEAQRLTGDTPPPIDAAVGYFLEGHWDVHPLVRGCAEACPWDRVRGADDARWDFRARYTAALHDHEEQARRPVREALGYAAPVAPALAAPPTPDPDCELCAGSGWHSADADGTPNPDGDYHTNCECRERRAS